MSNRPRQNKRPHSEPRPTETSVAELMQELRSRLHRAALLKFCQTTLRASFIEEGEPAQCLMQIEGYGSQPVDDEALAEVECQLAKLEIEEQARANRLLRRVVVGTEIETAGEMQAFSASVVRNPIKRTP